MAENMCTRVVTSELYDHTHGKLAADAEGLSVCALIELKSSQRCDSEESRRGRQKVSKSRLRCDSSGAVAAAAAAARMAMTELGRGVRVGRRSGGTRPGPSNTR